MKFTEYRSQALKALWVRVRNEYLYDARDVVTQPKFSPWEVDDICAVNWKYGNPIGMCTTVLLYYVEGLLLDKD